MGYSQSVLCFDCKIEIYLGYGGSGYIDLLRAYWPESPKGKEHAGHKTQWHCSDFTQVKDGKLVTEDYGWGPEEEVIIEDYSAWKDEEQEGYDVDWYQENALKVKINE